MYIKLPIYMFFIWRLDLHDFDSGKSRFSVPTPSNGPCKIVMDDARIKIIKSHAI